MHSTHRRLDPRIPNVRHCSSKTSRGSPKKNPTQPAAQLQLPRCTLVPESNTCATSLAEAPNSELRETLNDIKKNKEEISSFHGNCLQTRQLPAYDVRLLFGVIPAAISHAAYTQPIARRHIGGMSCDPFFCFLVAPSASLPST